MKYETLILLFLYFVVIGHAGAQSLRLFGVDASKFPAMSAKFYAFDATWNQKSPSIPELFLTENGIQRVITDVQCPVAQSPGIVSLAMSIDISSSMSVTVDYAKITTAELCNLILFPSSEFALQTCDDRALIVQDFTTNKTKITDALPGIHAEGGNDFNEHLLNRLTGLLNVAKNGKNKKIAVLFTDAWWFQLSPKELQECKDICDSNKIQFIAVIYSQPETEPNGIKKSLQELATYTGGMMYDGIVSKEAAKDIASKIQIAAQGSVGYCDITWESGVFCTSENPTADVVLSWNGTSVKTSYTLPASASASLSVTPNFISFGKIPPTSFKDTIITVTAQNADFTINNAVINFGSPVFSIINQTYPITVLKNTSKQLTFRFSPIDSSLNYVSFQLLSDKCSVEFSASGGFGGLKNKNPTLQLTKPNGGEEFLVGADTIISWKGIAASDTVTLKYSIDKGVSWSKITDHATGLMYKWTNIPKPASTNCLVKVQLKDAVPLSGIDWQNTYGGSANDHATAIRQTNDGGYIVVGESESTDGDGGLRKGMSDLWILKLSIAGKIEWKRNYGGSRSDAATCVRQTYDGGYIVGGYTDSNDGDIKIAKGSRDAWVLKLSKLGAIEWQKTIGGSKDDEVLAIEQSKDGTYIAAGWSESPDGDVGKNRGNADAWVLKLNPNGNIAWQYTYGGTNADFAESIVPTFDGGYIFAGHSYSTNGDVTGNKGFYDYWVVKIYDYGTLQWQRTYGGTGNEYAKSICQTSDSGYIVAGWSDSKDGDVTLNHGGTDFWVVKLQSLGGIEWQHSYGGSGSDYAKSILQTSDGGFAVAGYTYSNDGDITTNRGGNDAWILKLSKMGLMEWQKTYGGSKGDYAESLQQTTDDGYIFAGATDSKDNDAIGNKGKSDYWVIKLSSDGEVLQEDESDAVFSIVAPLAKSHDIDMQQCVVGKYRDSLLTTMVSNTGSYPLTIDTIYFRGTDAAAFVLTSGIPPYSIPVAGAHSSEIRFIPSIIGIHKAEIVIITQSDTLIQLIQGEGIAPILEVLGSFLDFGNVTVGKQKDTIHFAAVRNIGTLPLTITGTHHLGPNDKDYSTLSGGGNFTIQPNDTAYFAIRFAPKSIGRTSGRIALDYNGIGSPATITLFGTGINEGAHIEAIAPLFPPLICDSNATDILTIRNTGIDTLKIASAQFSGANALEFQFVSPFIRVIIPPDNTAALPIIFAPLSSGNSIATLELRSNAHEDSVLLLTLTGRKENLKFTTSITQWDIGILCPNEPKDTSIILTNKGTLTNTLKMQATNLAPGVIAISIAPSDTFVLQLRLLGRVNEGAFDEILTITDTICGVRQEVHVVGTIKRTKIISQQVADFGVVAGGSSTMLDIFAVNKDIRPIVIESPTGFAAPFTLDALVPPAGSILAPNDTVKARIRYDAVKGVQTKGYLNWSVILPCPSMDSTELLGVGIGLDTARTTVIAQDITAQAGEKVHLTLKLQKQSGMQIVGAPTEWYARIHYNKSIVFNEQTNNLCFGTADSCNLELSGVYNPNTDELISIPCITTLGNTDHSTIVIDTFLWMNSAILTEVATQNGTITLTGVCEDGGVRLFIPAKNSTSLSTRPNPAQDNLQIQYGLREPLTVTLELLTMTGQVAQTILNNQAQVAGQYTLTSDLSVLGNGVYLLRLKTNKEMLTTRVDVVK